MVDVGIQQSHGRLGGVVVGEEVVVDPAEGTRHGVVNSSPQLPETELASMSTDISQPQLALPTQALIVCSYRRNGTSPRSTNLHRPTHGVGVVGSGGGGGGG